MQKWLIGSMLLNAVLALAGAYTFNEQGGFDFLRSKVYEVLDGSPYTEPGAPFYESGIYRREASIYDRLPISAGDVVFIGDEQVAQGPWSEAFATIRVRNRGIVGETTEALGRRIESVLVAPPAAVFLSIGRNDLLGTSGGGDVADVVAAIRGLLDRVSARAPGADIYLLSALPYSEEVAPTIGVFNERLEPMARELGVTFIDLAAAVSRARRPALGFGKYLGGAEYAAALQAVAPHVEAALHDGGFLTTGGGTGHAGF